jgi:hypothetical protein
MGSLDRFELFQNVGRLDTGVDDAVPLPVIVIEPRAAAQLRDSVLGVVARILPRSTLAPFALFAVKIQVYRQGR